MNLSGRLKQFFISSDCSKCWPYVTADKYAEFPYNIVEWNFDYMITIEVIYQILLH